ncbi:MAG: NADPH:quinone reductase-like Zn-dependent oxidoreductase [Hyphomicrobiaceae bacterium]|jgi:NADPH:quinone reductase-like Zn-dependent oxidoreductase
MRAAVIDRYGTVEEFRFVDDFPSPVPAEGQVLVRVFNAGINPLDAMIRNGDLRRLLRWPLPIILGNDVAGEIVSCGPGVASFSPGDRVFGMMDAGKRPSWTGFARSGAYAEYAVTRADTLAVIPPDLTYEQASIVPLAALTAYQALSAVGIEEGAKILVNGAAGGVGRFAVQIAKALGATVVATCSASKKSEVDALGADRVVDYAAAPIGDLKQRFDVVYDVAAVLSYRKHRHLLRAGGSFVSNVPGVGSAVGTALGPILSAAGLPRLMHAWVRPSGTDLEVVVDWISRGFISARVDHCFPLTEVASAHRLLESKPSPGKLTLEIAA